jgi:hypothetical protein
MHEDHDIANYFILAVILLLVTGHGSSRRQARGHHWDYV